MDRRLLSFIIGFLTGFVSGLLGIGGGVLMVPMLMIRMGIDQRKAQGLSLLNMVFCTPIGAGFYYYSKGSDIDILTVLAISVGAVIGARHGAMLAQKASLDTLKKLFAGLLALTGIRILWRSLAARTSAPAAGSTTWLSTLSPWILVPIKALGGYGVGAIAGFFGIGGGVLYVVLLQLLLGFDAHAARGMSLAIIVPTAVFACQIYARKGNLPFPLIPPLLTGSIPGIIVGSMLALKMTAPVLNVIFGVFLIGVALRLAFRRQPA